MARQRKNELATVSFHYIIRETKDDDKNTVENPFSTDDFEAVVAKLVDFRDIDIKDEKELDLLRFKKIVPIEAVEKLNGRTVFGTFRGAYWGHAFENNKKGKIEADSVNLRKFYFLLYLSESGKIYVAAQYLGQYGGYQALRETLLNLLPNKKNACVHSLKLDYANPQAMNAKEVRISLSRKPEKIDAGNIFTASTMYVLQKFDKNDGFEHEVSRSFLSWLPYSKERKKEKIAQILRETQLIDVKDEDISDCSVIVKNQGRDKVIGLFDGKEFATKIPINVGFDLDGIPDKEDTKKEIIRVLKEQILTMNENV